MFDDSGEPLSRFVLADAFTDDHMVEGRMMLQHFLDGAVNNALDFCPTERLLLLGIEERDAFVTDSLKSLGPRMSEAERRELSNKALMRRNERDRGHVSSAGDPLLGSK